MSHANSSKDLVPVEHDEIVIEDDEREPTLAEQQQEIAEEIAAVSVDLARLAQEATEIVVDPEETGAALVPTTGTAAMAKKRLAVLRAGVQKQAKAMERKQAEIRARQEEMQDLMHKQMALAEEVMAPLEKFVKRLEEGIWMVNLYLGRDEQIVVLGDGEPAPADEPVVIRQLVLAMDQECAINPDDDGIDATNIEEFDEWLKADPAHVEQVLPNLKGVVALRPRFISKQYEDPWKNQAVAEANKQTYFLIRNGGKLYRTWTEFNVGDRLVPNANEFSSTFYEVKRGWGGKPDVRVPITPGTLAWERAEEAADAKQRHYMRVALILQGLVDRTTVFHPLPDSGISFTDFEHNGKTWKFLLDAELAVGTGRKPFRKWLAEKNAELQVGMRIVGSFTRTYSARDERWEERIHPKGAERPPSGELLTIEEKTAHGLIVRYKRNEQIWKKDLWVPSKDRPGYGHYGDYVEPKRRASCLLFPDDTNLLPFDLVTEEEMIAYLNARLDRHAYADMFPLLKAAIHAKRAEREEEAPFRTMLTGVLARENGVEIADAEEALDSLIEWWKLTNKNHRPLVGDEESQTKAVRMIVAEHARRVKAKNAEGGVVEKIRQQYPSAILVGRKRSGRYVALVPENDENVFVREYEFTAKSVEVTYAAWSLISKARVVRWTVAYTTERYDAWDFNATLRDHITGPEFDGLVEQVTRGAKEKKVVAVAYDPKDREFHTWRFKADAEIDVEHPLSGAQAKVKVEHVEATWERKGRDVWLRKEYRSHRSEHRGQWKPWDTRRSADGFFEHEDTTKNRYVVLYHDADLDAHVEAEKARYAEMEERRSAMNKIVRGLCDSIESAWVKRREATEYARFLEDYLDPELWEGHRKTLPPETFVYPHRYTRSYSVRSSEADPLRLLVERAVESGINLDGVTVWEAAQAYFPKIEPDPPYEIMVVSDGPTRTEVRQDPVLSPDSIPEDIREFRFVLPKPEPDEGGETNEHGETILDRGVLRFEE